MVILALIVGAIAVYTASLVNGDIANALGYTINAHNYSLFTKKYGWVAGFTEELLIDILSAIVVFGVFHFRKKCVSYAETGTLLGFLVGGMFGVLEVYDKLAIIGGGQVTLFFWQSPAFKLVWIPAIILHIINGMIGWTIVGLYLDERKLTKSHWLKIALGYLVLVAIHGFLFNMYLAHHLKPFVHILQNL